VGLQKVLLAAEALELAPAPPVGIPVSSQIAQPYPAIIGTVRLGTELRRGIHLARPSLGAGKPRGRDTQGWRARCWGLLTGGTVRSMGKPGKRLGAAGALEEQSGRLTWARAGGGATSCPPCIQEAAQPQEAYQQEVVEKEVVYHGGSLLFWKNADRLSGSQAEELSARWRYTTGEWDRTLESWREQCWGYYEAQCRRIGKAATPEMPLVCERFRVVYP